MDKNSPLKQVMEAYSTQMQRRLLGLEDDERAARDAEAELTGLYGNYTPSSYEKAMPYFAAASASKTPSPIGSLATTLGTYAKGQQELADREFQRKAELAKLKYASANKRLEKSDEMLRGLASKSLGKTGQGGMLPNGNEYIKAGDRYYEIIPDNSAPEGYQLREIVSAGKTILGTDNLYSMAAKATEKWAEGQTWYNVSPEERAARTEQFFQNQLKMLSSSRTPQQTIPPNATVEASQQVVKSAPGALPPTTTGQAEGPLPTTTSAAGLTGLMKELSDSFDRRESAQSDADRSRENQNIAFLRNEIKKAHKFDPLVDSMPPTAKATAAPATTSPTAIPQGWSISKVEPTNIDPAQEAARKVTAEGEAKIMLEEPQVRSSGQSAIKKMSTLVAKLAAMQKDPGLESASGWKTLLPTIPGSSSADFEGDMSFAEANAAFTALQAMRDASKTGGALGNITEKELGLLKDSLGAISLKQSPEKLKKGLAEFANQVKSSMENIRLAYRNQYGKDLELQ